jgi:HlyD family secretion protein
METARIKMEDDSLNYMRYARLLKEKVGTKADVEKREVMFRTSKNNYIAARERYFNTKTQLETELKNAYNNLKINAASRSDYHVRSMIDGRIYALYKESGEMVSPQEPLALLGDKNRFLVELAVDELDINKVKVGQKVLITLDTYGDKVFEATVKEIFPLLDSRTQTFKVEAEFTRGSSEVLYPGLTAEGNIIIAGKEKAMVIPRAFLFSGDSVMTEKGKMKKISKGLSNLEYVEVLSGLDISEEIYK